MKKGVLWLIINCKTKIIVNNIKTDNKNLDTKIIFAQQINWYSDIATYDDMFLVIYIIGPKLFY